MANYLLLRNNKESGPYSLDDLMTLGLKAYDLLWVQGKSAAWRYPSEIDELKPIAPMVEEQPFDRFYKKSEPSFEQKKIETVQQKIEIPKQEIPSVFEPTPEKVVTPVYEKPIVEPQYEKYIPKKSVAVTLPGQRNVEAKQPAREEVTPVTPVQPTIMISENPAAAQIKYSQPLDEIKEMYVKTLQDRKTKIARKTFWLRSLRKGAAVMSLVVLGLIAGFLIKSNTGKPTVLAQAEKPAPQQTVKTEPVTNVTDTMVTDPIDRPTAPVQQPPLHQPSGGYVNLRPKQEAKEPEPLVDRPVVEKIKKETKFLDTETKAGSSFLAQGLEADPRTGERNRKVRTANDEVVTNTPINNSNAAAAEKRISLPGDVSHLVSVKSNDYKRVAFGGIRDLQLTVTNDSKYILDNVVVEVQYIKPNELPLKTENIQFTSIAPNATSTVRLPDTNRGIKVVFKITHIKKRQADERVADN